MQLQEGQKRLFFGVEVNAPWPKDNPAGRLLDEAHRHMTLAFLGNVQFDQVSKLLPSIPKPPFQIGFAGQFSRCLLLPPRHPNVVAWHVEWLDDAQPLLQFQKQIVRYLKDNGFNIRDDRDFLAHVTVCRSPFDIKHWRKSFEKLPCMTKDFNLYESIGNLRYETIWKAPIKPPFEEIEHTADIAYKIHGENLKQLYTHAQIALAFRFPAILNFISKVEPVDSLEQIIANLNSLIAKADSEIGCPFKAVSYHGQLIKESDQTLTWEMIVDV
jgi:RNA 2',3'-cyclic 3'-phosphodiesterase